MLYSLCGIKMKCTVHDLGTLDNYIFAVTFARYNNKWIICRHKDRATWETSGGHIEAGETPVQAASRELNEETGAVDFDIEPVCDFSACHEPHEKGNKEWTNGQVFFARVKTLGELSQNSEMELISLFDEFPPNLTYPDITRELLPHILKKI